MNIARERTIRYGKVNWISLILSDVFVLRDVLIAFWVRNSQKAILTNAQTVNAVYNMYVWFRLCRSIRIHFIADETLIG